VLRELLDGMSKEEIIDLMIAYNEYLFVDHEDEFNHMDRAPVCLAEFNDCEYQEILEEREGEQGTALRYMGVKLDKAELPTKQEVLSYLETYGPTDRQLAHFRDRNYEAYGQDLIWNYPICDGQHFGFYIVPVREGFLNLPYNSLDEEECEVFVLENAYLMSAEDLALFLDQWQSYSDGLMGAMSEMIAIMKEEGQQNANT